MEGILAKAYQYLKCKRCQKNYCTAQELEIS